jgi:hypothetical protein
MQITHEKQALWDICGIPFIGINGLVAAYPRARAMTPTLFAAVSINTRQQNKTKTE